MAGHSKQYDILQSYIPLHVLFIIIDQCFFLFNVFRYHKHYHDHDDYFVLNLKHSIKINMRSKNYCNWYDQL